MTDTPMTNEQIGVLVERAEAAGHDERLVDGQLYLDLAQAIRQLQEEVKAGNEIDHESLTYWKARAEKAEQEALSLG